MNIVLDTHILIFASVGQLENARLEVLSDPKNNLFFSAVSLWEITKLYEQKKIAPENGLKGYLLQLCNHPKYTLAHLTPDVLAIMVEVSSKKNHGLDLANQLIVGTAIHHQAKLMTNDHKILQSKLVKTL